jgi:DNA-binding HxlR family transcriptional regulator
MKLVAKSTRIPKPRMRARGSVTGRPIMMLLDLLGRRWTLRLIWELREGRRLNFRELISICGISPSVLNMRLTELRENTIIELAPDGYALTAIGCDLLAKLTPLHDWAEAWARRK